MALTVLAFDFGERRIGVAVGNDMLRQAQPLVTLASQSNDERFSKIAQLIEHWQPGHLVVGMPLAADGTEHEMTRRARRFANQLSGRFALPVSLVDERYSSLEAAERNRDRRSSGHGRKNLHIDHHAAQIILERFFEANAHAISTS